MDRLSILLFAFFTFSFIVISYNVLYMERRNSAFIYQQERNLTTDVSEQVTLEDGVTFFQNDKDLEFIYTMNLERQATVADFCKKNNRIDEPVNTKELDNIIVDEKFKILFCYIPKVSCSAKRMLKSYFKFVFVREPFERLLSAYLEKFYSGDPGFHNNFGREIIRRYRPGGKPEDKNITFDEFVNYVINIGDGYWNEHWKTYDKLCHPCGVHYDFIGKFNNLEQEARYVLEITGISKELNISFPQVKPSSTSSKVPFFYSQIPKERLYRVVKLFGDDSEMFGYDLPKPILARMTSTD